MTIDNKTITMATSYAINNNVKLSLRGKASRGNTSKK
jgi:hypothetical protein